MTFVALMFFRSITADIDGLSDELKAVSGYWTEVKEREGEIPSRSLPHLFSLCVLALADHAAVVRLQRAASDANISSACLSSPSSLGLLSD